jgi:hypothetical protein
MLNSDEVIFMSIKSINDDIMPLKPEGEEDMADWTTLKCARCHGAEIWLMCKCQAQAYGATISGILKCGNPNCQNEHPFTMVNNSIQEFLPGLPVIGSQNLNTLVSQDIKDDIKEAERAEYMQCHKAAATMCRRALQIALVEKQIPDKPLSQMLEDAEKTGLLDDKTYILSTAIKGLGDIGAHRKEVLERGDIQTLIHVTVKMLNELAERNIDPSIKQKGKG